MWESGRVPGRQGLCDIPPLLLLRPRFIFNQVCLHPHVAPFPPDACRIQRDVADRGRDVAGVIEQYTKFVKPAFDSYVAPSRKHADVIIPWARGDNAVAIDLITEHIRMKLQQHDLRRIYTNLEIIPSNYQVGGWWGAGNGDAWFANLAGLLTGRRKGAWTWVGLGGEARRTCSAIVVPNDAQKTGAGLSFVLRCSPAPIMHSPVGSPLHVCPSRSAGCTRSSGMPGHQRPTLCFTPTACCDW